MQQAKSLFPFFGKNPKKNKIKKKSKKKKIRKLVVGKSSRKARKRGLRK